jgi:transposase
MKAILNLPSYHVIDVKEEPHDYHVKAEPATPPTSCSSCSSTNLVGGGRQETLIRDHSVHGKRVSIYVQARRLKCRDCGKTFTEPLPDVADGRRMTNRLYKWVCEQSLQRTFASLAEDVGCTEGSIRTIFREYIDKLGKSITFATPEWLGIDEIHIIGKPRCVITNIEHNKVVNLLENRNKPTVVDYLSKLPNRASIKIVTMDMWLPCKDAVYGVLPGAVVVIDKFHVVKMANTCLDTVRKSIREDLTTKQRRGLMHDRFFLLMREDELKPFQKLTLEAWTKNFPLLGGAYAAKERLFNMYLAPTRALAEEELDAWLISMTPPVKEAFKPLITAVTNWRTEIFNYFDHPVTNAYTESLNNLIRTVNRIGRGYSFEALRAKILYTKGAHQIVTIRPKTQRRESDMWEKVTAFTYTEPAVKRINYGVDISTLLRLIEEGKE